ncbi:hypothetical protein FJ364_04850, partial [Candidatus Dependentiae bacterium]|nr:hypothetical protein [Candidatus Dependentiae bacterium]
MSAFETLFPELSLEDFKNNYWPDKQPCLYHGEVGRLATILNISQKNNLKNILVEKPKNMFAWWKTDKVNLVPINASIAFDLYQL